MGQLRPHSKPPCSQGWYALLAEMEGGRAEPTKEVAPTMGRGTGEELSVRPRSLA